MMKIKNLKLASLFMAVVMILTCVPSVAFAGDLFDFESAEWDGGVSESEDLFGLSFDGDEAPAADDADVITFDDSVQGNVAEDGDWFVGEDLLSAEMVVDESTITFTYDPATKELSCTYYMNGSTDEQKAVAFWYTEEDVPEGITFDSRYAGWKVAATCPKAEDAKKESRVAVAKIDDKLYYSTVGKTATENPTEDMVQTAPSAPIGSTTEAYYFVIGGYADHDYSKEKVELTRPTCKDAGKRIVYTVCQSCGLTKAEAEDGLEKTDDDTYSATDDVPATGHDTTDAKITYVVSDEPLEWNGVDKTGENLTVNVSNTKLTDGKPEKVNPLEDGIYVEVASGTCAVCKEAYEIGTEKIIDADPVYGAVIYLTGPNIDDNEFFAEKMSLEDADITKAAFLSCATDEDTLKDTWYQVAHYDGADEPYKIEEKVYVTPVHDHIKKFYKSYNATTKVLSREITVADAQVYMIVGELENEDGTVEKKTLSVTDKGYTIVDIIGSWDCTKAAPYYVAEFCDVEGCPNSNLATPISVKKEANDTNYGPHVYNKDTDANTEGTDLDDLKNEVTGKVTLLGDDGLIAYVKGDPTISCAEIMDGDDYRTVDFCYDKDVTVVYSCVKCGKATESETVTVKGLMVKGSDEDVIDNHVGAFVGDEVPGTRVEATCTATGSFERTVICENCGNEFEHKTVVLPMKPHAYGEPSINLIGRVIVDNSGALQRQIGAEIPLAEDDLLGYTGFNYAYTVIPEVVEVCSTCPATIAATREVRGNLVGEDGLGIIEYDDVDEDKTGLALKAEIIDIKVQEQGKAACQPGTITVKFSGTYVENEEEKELEPVTATFPYYADLLAFSGRTDHVKGQPEIITNEDGSSTEVVKCVNCGEILESKPIAAETHEHDLRKVDATASCEEEGNIEYWVCADATCGKFFADENGEKELTAEELKTPALGHDFEGVELVPAKDFTCVADGNVEYKQCNRCEKYFDAEGNALETVVIPADANTFHATRFQQAVEENDITILIPAKAATCTEDGNIAYAKCPECGKLAVLADGVPTEVSAEDVIVKATGHVPGEPKIEDGYKVVYCTVCGEKLSSEKIEDEEPTQEVPGVVTIKKSSVYVNSNSLKVKVGPVEGATSYKIGVKKVDGKYTTKKITDASESVLFEGLEDGALYVVRAFAKNAAGNSKYSYKRRWMQSASLKVTALGNGSVKVDISGADAATKYVIRYSTTKDMASYETVTTTSASETISGLEVGTKYYFRVTPYTTNAGKTYRGALSIRKARTVK